MVNHTCEKNKSKMIEETVFTNEKIIEVVKKIIILMFIKLKN